MISIFKKGWGKRKTSSVKNGDRGLYVYFMCENGIASSDYMRAKFGQFLNKCGYEIFESDEESELGVSRYKKANNGSNSIINLADAGFRASGGMSSTKGITITCIDPVLNGSPDGIIPLRAGRAARPDSTPVVEK